MLVLGAITGFIFGFLLRKGRLVYFDVVVNQFLFKDFTVLKVTLSAIGAGSLGLYSLVSLGYIEAIPVKEAVLLANILGGAVFAVGMVLFGYCPGTAIGAVASGSRDAIWGILGGIFGAGFYAHLYPFCQKYLHSVLNLGQVTFPMMTHLSPWWFVGGFNLLIIGVFTVIELRESELLKEAR